MNLLKYNIVSSGMFKSVWNWTCSIPKSTSLASLYDLMKRTLIYFKPQLKDGVFAISFLVIYRMIAKYVKRWEKQRAGEIVFGLRFRKPSQVGRTVIFVMENKRRWNMNGVAEDNVAVRQPGRRQRRRIVPVMVIKEMRGRGDVVFEDAELPFFIRRLCCHNRTPLLVHVVPFEVLEDVTEDEDDVDDEDEGVVVDVSENEG